MQYSAAKTLVNTQCGLRFARSPKWISNELVFLDIHDRRVKSTSLAGDLHTVADIPYLPGGLDLASLERLIIGDAWRRKIYQCSDSQHSQLADLSNLFKNCIGDCVLDARGGMYVGDIGFDYLDPSVSPVPNGLIAHVDAEGKSSVVADNLYSPRGLIVTPDNGLLIVAESLGHCLTAFDIGDDGALHNRRVWAEFGDEVRPDGICLDQVGAIWVAGMGAAALRVHEGGEVDHTVATERPVFAISLGGPEGRHLFMCTSKSSDPVITRRNPDASIEFAEVAIP